MTFNTNDYTGVASIRMDGAQGTGVLLWTGRHILTAAHVFNNAPANEQITIAFNSAHAIAPVQIKSISIHPGWENDSRNFNNDIAIIELKQEVASDIARYEIYREFDEVGQEFSRVGFSNPSDPSTGNLLSGQKQFQGGKNIYDTTSDSINSLKGTNIQADYSLSYDHDNGQAAQDAWGDILNKPQTGVDNEYLARSGDSGGPAFIDNKVAGIASFIFRYQKPDGSSADINEDTDSTYGEIASDTRVSKQANWIDSIIDPNFVPKAPSSKEAVDKFPIEGDSGSLVNYFLLELSSPLAVDASVSYETLDGSAKAGSDYIATSGVAKISAGETKIAIAVEILGDTLAEGNETFYLRVFNPQGGIFPDSVSELKAFHTIVDNDNTTPSSQNNIELVGSQTIDAFPG